MAGRSKRARPSFLWQGILILGPVLVLLAIGVWTSWRDRDAMEREVRARMDPVATTLLSEFQDLLHPIRASRANDVVALGVSGTWFEIQPDNSLSQPHQFTWPPTPAPFPENLVDHLNPEPAQLWNQATTAEKARSWSRAAELYSAFANVKELLNQNRANTSNSLTEERLRGEAFSRMAAACLHVGDRKAAIQTFDAVLNSFSPGSDTRSEAGLSLAHLAALRIFELTPDFAEIPERWTTNTMQLLALLSNDRSPFGHELALRFQAWLQPKSNDQPSPVNMTEATFRVSEREEVKNWLEAQESWRLYHEAASSFGKEEWPALFWLEGDYSWLGVEQRVPEAAGRGRIFAAISREKIAETLAQIASREDRSGLVRGFAQRARTPIFIW